MPLATWQPANAILYNSKELDKDLGLNWYHYGARYYDPAVGRFTGVDPISDSFAELSVYNYASNSPISNIDLHGLQSTRYEIVQDRKFGSSDYVNKTFEERQENRASEATIIGTGLGIAMIFVPDPTDQVVAVIVASKLKKAGKIGRFLKRLFKGKKGSAKKIGDFSENILSSSEQASRKGGSLFGGRKGKQSKLKELAGDDKLGSADRGWIKQEINQQKRKKRKNIRNPPGKEMAHERGREAAKGFSYKFSKLQDKMLHRLQHKFDNFGRKNSIRPPDAN
ncbi:MAG TPA: hypothetical protein ENJ95_16220 [Bacteroidetes bacterium]|nr:hypothetical protein [Bacteroidota bacterium]